MNLSRYLRTYRTLRRLRPSQVYWRLRYQRERARPARPIRVPLTLCPRAGFSEVPGVHDPSDVDEQLADRLDRGEFEHLAERRALGKSQTDWLLGEQASGRLWAITLHYHQWAWELAVLARRGGPAADRAGALLRHYLGDWITRCDLTGPGSRELAWNVYAIATRLGWWCRLWHVLGPEGRRDWGPLERLFLESLFSQAVYLDGHLEYDLRANHLLRDAVGLAWAGRFLEGPSARRWLDRATRLALAQADEQVLADGGHFERSPMYHLHAMEDFLQLAFLVERPAAREHLRRTWLRMASFLTWARHPDGRIPLLNDAALNGACSPGMMLSTGGAAFGQAFATDLPRGGRCFSDVGLVVWHGEPWTVFFDAGPVGVDYQPGHAHADTLSIEVSYRGQRLFVDPGTFGYDRDDRRRYDRATASHNTVAIDGVDSSEVWHVFRVGRRAVPVDIETEIRPDALRAAASHTGYDHLPGRPRHRRVVAVSDDDALVLNDSFRARGRHAIAGALLLAPGWEAKAAESGWILSRGNIALRVAFDGGGGWELSQSAQPCHPGFGVEEMTTRLQWRAVLALPCETVLRIEPFAPDE
ncbi:MAG: alginate lyase family protein [Pirellulales bacterium]|nr:alginate lyase family protein [Pirellulales bacterium]